MNWLRKIFEKWWKEDRQILFHNFLKEEVLETLCRKILIAMFFNVAVASGVLYLLLPFTNEIYLTVWYIAILLFSLYRGIIARKKCIIDQTSIEKRYRKFRMEATITALLWTMLPLFFYPHHDLIAQLIMLALLLGIAVGGAMNIAIDQKIAELYVLLILGVFGIHFFSPDPLHFILTLLLLFFIITLLYNIHQLHRIVARGILQYSRRNELQYRLHQIFEQAPVGMLYFNREYRVVDINEAMSKIFGIPKEMMRHRDLLTIKDKRAIKDLPKVIENGMTIQYEGPYVTTATNEEIWISVIFSPVRNTKGSVVGGVAVIQDKSAEHEALSQVEFLAYHDPLTHLPNRKLLEDRYRLQITQAAREKYYSAMLFLDLDRFKHINDTYGHGIGDEMIKETAKRLQNILRQSDTITRLSGDEFIIFLPMLSKVPEQALSRVWQISEKIHNILGHPYILGNHTLYVTASIGAILIHGDREPIEEILRKVDIAMYHAKHQGKGMTSFYEKEMDRRLRRTIELEHALRHAIERNELYLEFQPIVRAKDGRTYGAETLLRWRISDGTLISPAEFIPVAEENTLIHEIGMWVIEQACKSIKELKEDGLFHFEYISINLSSKQFGNRNLFDEVMAIFQRYSMTPNMIKFEITESILMEDPHSARNIIDRFHEAGIGFMIDDFGTGYSSLSYLKTFRFETIKIDRTFIRDILDDPDDVTLVNAILDIAHQFDNRVVAEGVESHEQEEVLELLEPQILCQGFYYSPPLPLNKFKEWIAAHS